MSFGDQATQTDTCKASDRYEGTGAIWAVVGEGDEKAGSAGGLRG